MATGFLPSITAIGGIILGAVFSVIAYQYKESREKKTSLLELLAEMLKMNEVLYEMILPLKHDMVREYFSQYVAFFNRTYGTKITADTIPEETRNVIRDSFKKDLESGKIDFSEADWNSFFASLDRIKGYYPILYMEIWRNKREIRIFRELIDSLPERTDSIKKAFLHDVGQSLPLSQDFYNEESLRNLTAGHKLFQSNLFSVARKAGWFTVRKVRKIIDSREKMMERGYDFSFLERSWKNAIESSAAHEAR